MTLRFPLVAVALAFCGTVVYAEVWVGPANRSGAVQRPSDYIAATSHLFHSGSDFEKLPVGSNVVGQDLGGFHVSSMARSVISAKSGTIAGTVPSSGKMSLYLGQVSGLATDLELDLFEPVMSVGLTVMGLESATTLRVFGGEPRTQLLGEYTIPGSGATGLRRWIGVYEDERTIWRIQLVPGAPEDYAIDDVEVGVHAPEPGGIMLGAVGAMLVLTRRRRGVQVV